MSSVGNQKPSFPNGNKGLPGPETSVFSALRHPSTESYLTKVDPHVTNFPVSYSVLVGFGLVKDNSADQKRVYADTPLTELKMNFIRSIKLSKNPGANHSVTMSSENLAIQPIRQITYGKMSNDLAELAVASVTAPNTAPKKTLKFILEECFKDSQINSNQANTTETMKQELSIPGHVFRLLDIPTQKIDPVSDATAA